MTKIECGLAYFGITIIPPESLKFLEEVLLKINTNNEIDKLIEIVREAIIKNKHIIHFGI